MLAIIIVNYKNEIKTIEYVKNELIKVKVENIIIIVNNESSTITNNILKNSLNAELITDLSKTPSKNKKIFILANTENLGFARGNNFGVEFSLKYYNILYFLFSNNDIRVIDNHVVEEIINTISSKPDIALIGPRVIGIDGKNQSPEPYYSFWNRYIWMLWISKFISAEKKNKLFQLGYSQNAKEGVHYKVMGSFFLVKAIDFIKCQMMDPHTFLYAEEIILSERLKSIGKKVYYYPEVAVLHEHGQTTSLHISEIKKKWLQFSSECYYYKTYKNISYISVFLGSVSFSIYLLLKKTILIFKQ